VILLNPSRIDPSQLPDVQNGQSGAGLTEIPDPASWDTSAGGVAGISNLDVFHSFFKSQNRHMHPRHPKNGKNDKIAKTDQT
jgi:hypothetical protein